MDAWEIVDIQVIDSLNEKSNIDAINYGLDTTAEQMHFQFLSDIQHLEEVSINHQIISKSASRVINDSKTEIRNLEESMNLIEEIDELLIGNGITIEIEDLGIKSLSVSKMVRENGSLVRIIQPERFGGMIRTYKLPAGFDLDSAVLQEGFLKLSFN
tara:strand:- start:57760 stop:58230 length:471 start_codon:yes stop_codon:yes gene_type:complete